MKNVFPLLIISITLFTQCSRKVCIAPVALKDYHEPVKQDTTIPLAIQKKIDDLKSQAIQTPPATIYQYDYNGQKVYYFNASCCDQFSTLLNDKGELICHPDGGITGKGDGKCSDFAIKRTNEVLIWKDDRK